MMTCAQSPSLSRPFFFFNSVGFNDACMYQENPARYYLLLLCPSFSSSFILHSCLSYYFCLLLSPFSFSSFFFVFFYPFIYYISSLKKRFKYSFNTRREKCISDYLQCIICSIRVFGQNLHCAFNLINVSESAAAMAKIARNTCFSQR